MSAVTPMTPSRRGEEPLQEMNELYIGVSKGFNLQLHVPKELRSPRKLNPYMPEDLNELIYARFRQHWCQKRETLDQLLSIFTAEAVRVVRQWVLKPRADPSLTPAPSKDNLPKAMTPHEIRQLRNLLLEILRRDPAGPRNGPLDGVSGRRVRDDHRTPGLAKLKEAFARPGSNGQADGSLPQNEVRQSRQISTQASKRPSEEWAMPVSKRSNSLTAGKRHGDRQSHIEGRTVKIGPGPVRPGRKPVLAVARATEQVQQRSGPLLKSTSFDTALDTSVPSTRAGSVVDEWSEDERSPPSTQMTAPEAEGSEGYSCSLTTQHYLDLVASHETTTPLGTRGRTRGATRAGMDDRLEEGLRTVWPRMQGHMAHIPLACRWEVLRVCVHNKLVAEDFQLPLDTTWSNYDAVWKALAEHKLVKSLPERSSDQAWSAAYHGNFQHGAEAVVLSASLDYNAQSTGPLFLLKLHPLTVDKSHRLSRRFGADRFLELLVPSMSSSADALPAILKRAGDEGVERVKRWMAQGSHPLVERNWVPFYIRPVRDGPSKKAGRKEEGMGPKPVTVIKDRLYLFATDGSGFRGGTGLPDKTETVERRSRMSRIELADWLLQLSKNTRQPSLKLFARIALGLSRTTPTVVLRGEQIRRRDKDVLSPTGQVMNDGIGRLSPALARRISQHLGLDYTPAGFQGRLGSAKGLWIQAIDCVDYEDWIETYPSQRKWECDLVDEHHRTFEVSSQVKGLKSASLNTQLLPILEAGAGPVMKSHVGNMLREVLEQELQDQREAVQDPVLFRAWAYDAGSSGRRIDAAKDGQMPFQAGLPKSAEDQIGYLLDAGFHPVQQDFLFNLGWKQRQTRCKELRTRFNIKMGCSTYAYMAVDFQGVLAEDEIHLAFSDTFRDRRTGYCDSYLHGMDVLVARLPAHFATDVQRVRAVFKPELGALKDVVIFPTTGKNPLADMLSGGDYDGDMAFVCWDQNIVKDFTNAVPPRRPDLFAKGVLSKQTGTYQDLLDEFGEAASSVFFDESFRFNMQANFLGQCTSFKENYCYKINSVQDDDAVWLSTLLSNLVDQAKQGIVFTRQDWHRFRKRLRFKGAHIGQPAYKNEHQSWADDDEPVHIIDFLHCLSARVMEKELKELNKLRRTEPTYYDEALLTVYKSYDRRRQREVDTGRKRGLVPLLDQLNQDLEQRLEHWMRCFGKDVPTDFESILIDAFSKFRDIEPFTTSKSLKKELAPCGNEGADYSRWALLKASALFKKTYRRGKSMVWYLAGRQLCYMKAQSVAKDGPLALVVPGTYWALKPDVKLIRAAKEYQSLGFVQEAEEEHLEDDP